MVMTPSPDGDGVADPDLPAAGYGGEPVPMVSGRASVPVRPAAQVGRAQVGRAQVGPAPSRPAPAQPRTYPANPVYSGKKKLRPRWGRIALVAAAVLLLVGGVAVVGGLYYAHSVDNKIKRDDPFAGLVGRPPVVTQGAVNMLLLGSDSRDPDAVVDQAGKWRTDTIVLLHLDASHDKAYLISMPRDLYVFVPQSKTGPYGNTMAKINAAYAWGGEPLMVQTVEGYTGVHLDHVALIDFAGFERVVDALGGVDMYIEQTVTSIHGSHQTYRKGDRHLIGSQALDYIRQRKQFPDGDFARIRHQQQFLKALLDKAVSTGTITNLPRLNNFLTSVAGAVRVDKDFSLLDMVWQFHGLRSSNLTFLTSPNKGSETIGGESVVVSDKTKASSLFDAMAKDTVASWITANPTPSK